MEATSSLLAVRAKECSGFAGEPAVHPVSVPRQGNDCEGEFGAAQRWIARSRTRETRESERPSSRGDRGGTSRHVRGDDESRMVRPRFRTNHDRRQARAIFAALLPLAARPQTVPRRVVARSARTHAWSKTGWVEYRAPSDVARGYLA